MSLTLLLLKIAAVVLGLIVVGAIYCYWRFERQPMNRADDPSLDPETFGEEDGQDNDDSGT